MTTIRNHYVINENTMALLPAAHMDYDTIAIERDQERFVRETPQQIISRSCLQNGSTYEGRRAAIMHHFGFKRKIPIPINPRNRLFTFPTNAPTDFACNWIFYRHVQAILPPSASSNGKTSLLFHNGQQLPVDVSRYVLEKQLERAGMCAGMFGGERA
ncbi:competence protein ComK [Lentibacillus halophilus]|uniref:Competence protein ComK n=1 Tax=Lentibacillus halophilus TaxID=295065 RepID=A0ABN0Z1N3_9BACI